MVSFPAQIILSICSAEIIDDSFSNARYSQSRRSRRDTSYSSFDSTRSTSNSGSQKTFSHIPETLPQAGLNVAQVMKVIGDCTDLRVLVLGDGSGCYARIALHAGATQVDVVDWNSEELELGEELEASEGRDSIRWILGDVVKPFDEQVIIPSLPRGEYDIVLAFTPFMYVSTMAEYKALWTNITTYLRPGGRMVGCKHPFAHQNSEGNAGVPNNPSSGRPVSFEKGAAEKGLMYDIQEVPNSRVSDTHLKNGRPKTWTGATKDPGVVIFTAKKSYL